PREPALVASDVGRACSTDRGQGHGDHGHLAVMVRGGPRGAHRATVRDLRQRAAPRDPPHGTGGPRGRGRHRGSSEATVMRVGAHEGWVGSTMLGQGCSYIEAAGATAATVLPENLVTNCTASA